MRRSSLRLLLPLLATLLAPPLWAAPGAAVTFQHIDLTELPRVSVFFTVTDAADRSILGLTEQELAVSLDGTALVPDSIESVLVGGENLAVVLLFDRSGSMKEALERTKSAAVEFVRRLSVGDEIAVVSFDDVVRVDGDFTADLDLAAEAIEGIAPGNDTAFYDAIVKAGELLAASPHRRRAVVILSDGKDTKSVLGREDALAAASQSAAPLYAISLAPEAEETGLMELASSTGGRFFAAAGPADLLALYQLIAEQLNNQYLLQFSPPLGADESWHTLEIRLQTGDLDTASERQFIASSGPGVSRARITGFERQLEQTDLAGRLAVGGLAGLLIGLLLFGLAKLARPEIALFSVAGLGLLLSAGLSGVAVAAIWHLL